MRQQSKTAILAYSENTAVGMLVFIVGNRIKTKHTATIYSVYINKNYRGQGVGKKLVKEALDLIKQNKEVINVNLGVNPEQVNAVKLYESFGFKIVGLYQKETFIDNKFYNQAIMELFFQSSNFNCWT